MRARKGFTLVEVMIALVILMVVIVGFASTTGRLLHTVATTDRQEGATNLVTDRLDQVRLEPVYGRLESLFVATETNLPGMAGYTRVTAITRVLGVSPATDHKVVTVTVTGPALLKPVARTITVAAP